MLDSHTLLNTLQAYKQKFISCNVCMIFSSQCQTAWTKGPTLEQGSRYNQNTLSTQAPHHFVTWLRSTWSLVTRFRALQSKSQKCSLEPDAGEQRSRRQNQWWRRTGSNRRPEACKATALPTELRPRTKYPISLVGLSRLELPTSRLSGVRSNHLSYRPETLNYGSN